MSALEMTLITGTVQRAHERDAALIVSQFLHVKKNLLQEAALGPNAKASEVNSLAATLTAGIWGKTDSGESA